MIAFALVLVVIVFFGSLIRNHNELNYRRRALAELERLDAIQKVNEAKALNAERVTRGEAPLICERCGVREIEAKSTMCSWCGI